MYDVKIIHFYMVEYKKNGKKMNIEIQDEIKTTFENYFGKKLKK